MYRIVFLVRISRFTVIRISLYYRSSDKRADTYEYDNGNNNIIIRIQIVPFRNILYYISQTNNRKTAT